MSFTNFRPNVDALTDNDYVQTQRIRTQVMDSMDRVFKNGIDFVLTPTSAATANPAADDSIDDPGRSSLCPAAT